MAIFKKVMLWAHKLHGAAYSYYKVRESGILVSSELNSSERDFFLNFQPALNGKDLIVYDIGAARGIVSSCLSKLKNVHEIHAFEPLPDFFQKLDAQMQENKKVTCHNIALGDKAEILPMYVNNWATSSSFLPTSEKFEREIPEASIIKERLEIEVMRIDDYVAMHSLPIPDLIKIDVQGFEKKVIEGGVNLFKQCRYCTLEMSFNELYEGSPLFDDMYRFMSDLGFQLIGLTEPMIGKSGLPLQVDGIFENTHLS